MPTVTKQAISALGRRQPMKQHYTRHVVPYTPRVSGLGDTTSDAVTVGACVAAAFLTAGATASAPPCQHAMANLTAAFFNWITGKLGQYKIDATQFAEGIVKLCYGWEPGCALPTHGEVPIVPGANPPLFCASSVAGMIERCQLYNASVVLQKAQQSMQQKLSLTNDPVTVYIKRWYDQYGIPTFADLNSHLSQAQAQCGSGAMQPTAGFDYSTGTYGGGTTGGGGGGTYYPPISTGGTTNYTPYLILGGIGLVGLFLAMR